MNLSTAIIAILRTAVPAAVGTFLVWASKALGVDLSGLISPELAVAACTGLYWLAVTALVNLTGLSWLGVLLGHPATPQYKAPTE